MLSPLSASPHPHQSPTLSPPLQPPPSRCAHLSSRPTLPPPPGLPLLPPYPSPPPPATHSFIAGAPPALLFPPSPCLTHSFIVGAPPALPFPHSPRHSLLQYRCSRPRPTVSAVCSQVTQHILPRSKGAFVTRLAAVLAHTVACLSRPQQPQVHGARGRQACQAPRLNAKHAS